MRRVLVGISLVVVAVVLGPPAYYALFGGEGPSLPPPGKRVRLADGARLNVLDRGAGPVVVLVHGLPGSAYDWAPLMDQLVRRGLRVVAYDRKGYGYSDLRAPGEASSYQANARELLELLEALDLRHVTVVGWSYGGGTAMVAASRDASRMAGVVLLASAGPLYRAEEPSLAMRVLLSGAVRGWVRRVPPVARALVTQVSVTAFSGPPMPDWWVPQTLANLSRPGVSRTQRREERELRSEALHPEAIGVPVLVIHGTRDRFVSFAQAEDLLRRCGPHAEMLRVEGGSHMIAITHSQLVAERIEAFSAAHP
ncbi:MAG: alpha/beta fold hydrolase [Myxococcota bacterium]